MALQGLLCNTITTLFLLFSFSLGCGFHSPNLLISHLGGLVGITGMCAPREKGNFAWLTFARVGGFLSSMRSLH